MLGCECKPFSDLPPFARTLCVWKGAFLWCGVFWGGWWLGRCCVVYGFFFWCGVYLRHSYTEGCFYVCG